MNPFKDSDFIKRVESWNSKFPLDLLWRLKYNTPFGSDKHRQMDFFDIKFDILEEKYFKYLASERKYKVENPDQLLKKDKAEEIEEKSIKDDFENLDLDSFNNVKV